MTFVDTVFALFDRFGDRDYGEDVTQRDHALQVADHARAESAPDTLVAAGLLHDIGHFLDNAGDAAEREGRDARHEHSGAAFLAPYFPPAVVEPIRLHVAAKRYLCLVDRDYLRSLSDASALSLRLQGGPFTPPEAAAFERMAHAEAAVRLRRYDDRGKSVDRTVEPIDFYRPLLIGLSRERGATSPGLPHIRR